MGLSITTFSRSPISRKGEDQEKRGREGRAKDEVLGLWRLLLRECYFLEGGKKRKRRGKEGRGEKGRRKGLKWGKRGRKKKRRLCDPITFYPTLKEEERGGRGGGKKRKERGEGKGKREPRAHCFLV